MQGGFVIQAAEVIGVLALYFLPALLADRRKRHDMLTIALFNACLGWTVFCWLVALYWALQPNPPKDIAREVRDKRRMHSMRTFSKGLLERAQRRSTKTR
jgi:hypothetical protein